MSDNEFEPYKVPALRKAIARAFVTIGSAFGSLAPPNIAADPKQSYLNLINRYAWFLIPFWLLLIGAVSFTLFSLFDGHFRAGAIASEDIRWRYLSITAMIAALGAMIAVPFTLVRVYVNERQARTAEAGLITDRITKAIEQLGAEKTVKALDDGFAQKVGEQAKTPNLEIRLGAILALERLAMETKPVRMEITKLLASYIRLNGGRDPYPTHQDEWLDGQSHHRVAAVKKLPAPWPDLQMASEVIGRLIKAYGVEDEFQVELRNANLQRVDLNGLCLKYARLHGADLRGGVFKGSDFTKCNMAGANLAYADLREATFSNATLNKVNVRGADLSDAKGLTQEHVKALFGDTETKLPDYLRRTTELNHKPLENPWDDDPEYERWKAAGYPEGDAN